jgi:hypothetical protein
MPRGALRSPVPVISAHVEAAPVTQPRWYGRRLQRVGSLAQKLHRQQRLLTVTICDKLNDMDALAGQCEARRAPLDRAKSPPENSIAAADRDDAEPQQRRVRAIDD